MVHRALSKSMSAPFGVAQFARPNEHIWSKLHGKLADRMALITIDSPQEFANALRFQYRSVVGDGRIGQSAPQIARGVRWKTSGCHGIAEHAPSQLKRPAGAFEFALALDPADGGKHVSRLDFGDG